MGEATESQCEQFALSLAVAIFPIFLFIYKKAFCYVLSKWCAGNRVLVLHFAYIVV